ncbi:hypothetical protein CK203_030103 [Vitis vinifera]|uniref:Uncharacterized protein n=1 Tax=Vitis vinifera TaxID=29760 RepID=A0A438I5H2_VITVI|nr:hypothetical protein CK203_030103 [Vitis vinifera]
MTTISVIRPPSQLLLPRLDLFSSITTTSALPTVTLANDSQTMAKGPEYEEDDWHRTCLAHPSLSKSWFKISVETGTTRPSCIRLDMAGTGPIPELE